MLVGSVARWYERDLHLLRLLVVAALRLGKPDLHEIRRLVVGQHAPWISPLLPCGYVHLGHGAQLQAVAGREHDCCTGPLGPLPRYVSRNWVMRSSTSL